MFSLKSTLQQPLGDTLLPEDVEKASPAGAAKLGRVVHGVMVINPLMGMYVLCMCVYIYICTVAYSIIAHGYVNIYIYMHR